MARHSLNPARALVVLLAWPAAGHGAGQLASHLDRSITYYEVTGADAAELRAALDRSGPLDAAGTRWDGYTAWQLSWRFHYREQDGACRIDRVETWVRIDMTLPRWRPPAEASAGLERRWRRYASALAAHEDGHQQIARDAAAEIERVVAGLEPRAGCEPLKQAGDAAAAQILGQARRREIDYDRRTAHGARQGARFP